MLPKHGKINCRDCFSISDKEITEPHHEWRMINDPGAWGGDVPKYLVLGFSKGATQAGIYKTGRFEDIAFAGMRPRLTKALQSVGVLEANETVDEKINTPESNIAFGSLIRCSVSRLDKKATKKHGKNIFACTGPLITKSFLEIPHVIDNCISNFLSELPSTIQIVFFLGNADTYVRSCQALIRENFPTSFESVNPMAVKGGGFLWVHLAHPSGLNGHFNTWLNSTSGSGLKRIYAIEAIKCAY